MSSKTHMKPSMGFAVFAAVILGLLVTGDRLVADDAADQAALAAERAEALRDLAVAQAAEAAQIEAAAKATELKEQEANQAEAKL